MANRLFAFFCCWLGSFTLSIQAQVYVAVNGSDNNPGTRELPKASVQSALRLVREMRRLHDPAVTNGIHILIGKGTYFLDEPLFIRPEDAGTAQSPTWIESGDETPAVLSGGRTIQNWKQAKAIPGLPAAARGKVWEADLSNTALAYLPFRQLWVNGEKALRAKEPGNRLMGRILSWNKKDGSCWIPTPPAPFSANAPGVEMLIHQWWAIAILRIQSMEVQGDSTRLRFMQPEARIQNEHPWPAPWISKETGNSAFYLSNSIQFLNEPGEWYLDRQSQKMYYWPRPAEVMPTATVIAPVLETLVKLEGTIDNPVAYIRFKRISFQHTGFLRPSQQGHVPHQAGMYMLDAYKLKVPGTPDKKGLENQAWIGRPPSAVVAVNTDETLFESCRFQRLAATGLDFGAATHRDTVNACLFKDIGGSGIIAGIFADESGEIHLPYQPKDDRVVCDHITISNNLVTDVTNEDWGCVGIGAGYVKNISIIHNEIADVGYTGISVGWGWTKTVNAMRNNLITANKISHYAKHMYDVAAIYTLSAQPGTVISNNYVDSIYKAPYAHLPEHWFYLYTDEGSSYMTVKDNWCPSEKFLQNANGPGNEWKNNGPMVVDSIRLAAGLQPQYRDLLDEKVVDGKWPINH